MSGEGSEFRIVVSIQRNDGADEYDEIGFCAGDSDVFDDAVYEATTFLNRREWETPGDMPEPHLVDVEVSR